MIRTQTEMEARWVHVSKELIITLQQQCPFISCLSWPKARVGKGKKSHSKMQKNGNCHRKSSAANSCALWGGVWHGQTIVRNGAELVWLWNGDTKTWGSPLQLKAGSQHRFPSLQLELAAPATAFHICLVSFCALTHNSVSATPVIWVSPAGQDNV